MDIDDGETSQPPKVRLSQLPEDDFGTVRERRDFGPMDTPLHPILPSPYRDASFSALTGWRYYPTANEVDRLGIGNDWGVKPSTQMVIPDSWNDRVIDHSKAAESTRRQLEKLKAWEDSKRRRISSPFCGGDSTSQDIAMSEDSPSAKSTQGKDPKKSTPAAPAATTKTCASGDATVVTASTSSTANTLATTSTASSTVLATDVVPKQELFFFYQKWPRKVHLKGTDYLTWGNEKPVQDLLYSSAFVCPITKEIFLAGRYGDTCVQQGGLAWYSTKKVAEHAAAARAWDCWNVREGRHHEKQLSLETPYTKEDAPELPFNKLPAEMRLKIQEIRKEQAKLEEEKKNKPPSPPRQYYDRGSSSNRGTSNGRDYDRRQGVDWNNNRGRGRWEKDSSSYQRQQRHNGRGYNAGPQRGYGYSSGHDNTHYAYNHMQAGVSQQRGQNAGNYSTGYGGPSAPYPGDRHHASNFQQRQPNAAVGNYSTGYDGSYSQRTSNGGNYNHTAQEYAQGAWQQDERSSSGLPPLDAPSQHDDCPS